MRSLNLFESERLSAERSIELTIESLTTYAERYQHWIIAFSGGKDSTAVVTLIVWLIKNNLIPKPKTLKILYSDTRLEIVPLQFAAFKIMEQLRELGIECEVVMPTLDDRFFVYMFGRGVPPPSNTFRWCTSQLKIEPMQTAIIKQAVNLGFGEMVFDEKRQKEVYQGFGKDKILTITGVRLGESAARDQRIAQSCSRDGSECGQGWLQQSPKEGLNDTLAPILHWRVCHVWDWLKGFIEPHSFDTQAIADVYGISEDGSDAENGTRTGCVGCNLASRDTALDNLLKLEQWNYLSPLKRLKPLYAELKKPHNRLRKHGETNTDGKLAKNQGRLGPLTMEARLFGLDTVISIEQQINSSAKELNRPQISLINKEEYDRILELIDAGTYPNKWDGTEHRGDEWLPTINRDGSVQELLF